MSGLEKEPAEIPMGLAEGIRIVVLDVDGVLTDAGVYIGATGRGEHVELKRFDIQDGIGIRFLKEAGIRVIVVSGRVSPATAIRADELGIECHQDPDADKLPLVKRLLDEARVSWREVAMMGDDLADLPLLRTVGLPVAVANAVTEVRDVASWTTSIRGGSGAVREFARALLMARGEWSGLVEEYCEARSGR